MPQNLRESADVTYPAAAPLLRQIRTLVRRNRRSEAPEGPRRGLTPARPAQSQVVFYLHPYYPVIETLGGKLDGFPLHAAASVGLGYRTYPGASKGMQPNLGASNIARMLPTNYAEYLESIGGESGIAG